MDKSTKKREKTIDSSSQKREKDSMKRKIYNELLAWKQERKGKTAILIDGARRIGKSYIVEEFARREYQSYILVDFNNADPNLIEIFDKYLTHLDLFFSYLSLYFNVKLHERNSLIIGMITLKPVRWSASIGMSKRSSSRQKSIASICTQWISRNFCGR